MAREKSTSAPSGKKRAPRTAAAAPRKPAATRNFVAPDRRRALIAEAAWFRAEKRGFAPGHEDEDWLAAEAEVDARLLGGADPAATS